MRIRLLFFYIAICFINIIVLLSFNIYAQDTVLFPILIKEKVTIQSNIPDTGIYYCTNDTYVIECPGFSEDFYGQDAHYNPTHQQHRYTDNEDSTITDQVTGLMWMKDDNDGLFTWQGAANYCDYLVYANYDDWRLPNFYELSFLTDRSRYNPEMTIDPIFSGHVDRYWSSSPDASDTGYAWYVSFSSGAPCPHSTDITHYARCVRSGPLPTAHFVNNNDKTITDKTTGLMWLQDAADTDGDKSVTTNDGRIWEEALAFCKDLTFAGHDDWRLPNINELQSLIDVDTYGPSINPILNCPTEYYYCSSSPFAFPPPSHAEAVWEVDFYTGIPYAGSKNGPYYFRCVRGGP